VAVAGFNRLGGGGLEGGFGALECAAGASCCLHRRCPLGFGRRLGFPVRLRLCQLNGDAGGEAGVVEHQRDVCLEAFAAGKREHFFQQERGHGLALNALSGRAPQGGFDMRG
jgi:hypothetical protein